MMVPIHLIFEGFKKIDTYLLRLTDILAWNTLAWNTLTRTFWRSNNFGVKPLWHNATLAWVPLWHMSIKGHFGVRGTLAWMILWHITTLTYGTLWRGTLWRRVYFGVRHFGVMRHFGVAHFGVRQFDVKTFWHFEKFLKWFWKYLFYYAVCHK